MIKVAPQADLWYNRSLKYICPGNAYNIPGRDDKDWSLTMYNSITRILCLCCSEYLPAISFLRNPDGHGYEPACISCRDKYEKPILNKKCGSQWGSLVQCEICGKKKMFASYMIDCDREHPICASCTRKNRPLKHQPGSYNYQRTRLLKHAYNITDDDYNDMFVQQFGLCAICGNAPKESKMLHIDHCHASGIIRGLLCQHCNQMLGNARENINTLKNAINYLKKHSS